MERFWKKVKKGGNCWEWIAGKNTKGYGIFDVDGRLVGAHRMAYELTHGDIPDGMCVCHTCDNPSCVNPDHLWIGTPQDNSSDMVAKGRTGSQVGEENSRARLSADTVLRIREMFVEGVSQTDIAKRFGTCRTNVVKIVNRRSWTHV